MSEYTDPATERQQSMAMRIGLELKDMAVTPERQNRLNEIRSLWAAARRSRSAMADYIDRLILTQREWRLTAPEGMHRLPDGRIFKVQRAVHRSGHPYAKQLVLDFDCDDCDSGTPCGNGCTPTVQFVYVPGALRELGPTTVMKLEEAKAFGALYGTCCVCGRTLTDENSIAAGVGPVCAEKFLT